MTQVRHKIQAWGVGFTLTLVGLAAMIVASAMVIGFSATLGRGVYFMLILVAVILAGLLGLAWRWLARG